MPEYRESVALGRAARKENIVALHLDEPGDRRPGIFQYFLRLPSLLVRRRRVPRHSGSAIEIRPLLPPHACILHDTPSHRRTRIFRQLAFRFRAW